MRIGTGEYVTAVPPGIVRMVRDRILAGQYEVGSHVRIHGRQERFGEEQACAAVLNGIVVDWMPDRQRLLFCGRVRNDDGRFIWLHVVVAYLHPIDAAFVTAYTPNPAEWEEPPLRRRR
jgi:hypothetical protein